MSIQQSLLGAAGGFTLDFDYGSVVNGLEDTGTVSTLERPRVFADRYNENRFAITFTDDDGSKRGYLRLLTRSGNTLTASPTYDAADENQVANINGIFIASGKILIHYDYNSKAWGRIITFSGSAGSESFSRSSAFQITNRAMNWEYGCQPEAIGTTGRYLMPYYNYNEHTNGSRNQDRDAYLRIVTATTSAVTHYGDGGSDGMWLQESAASAPRVVMHPDDDTKALMCVAAHDYILVFRPLTLSGTGNSATASVGSRVIACPSVSHNGIAGHGFAVGAPVMLVSCGGDKFVAFAGGAYGAHKNKLVGIAFDWDGSSFTLGSPSYAPTNITAAVSMRYKSGCIAESAPPDGTNKIGLSILFEDQINSRRPIYGISVTRNNDRTLTWSDVTLLGNGANSDPTNLHHWDMAVQSDSANTCLTVWNNNLSGTNYGNLAGKLWRLGS